MVQYLEGIVKIGRKYHKMKRGECVEKKIVLATLSLLPLSTMSVDANSIGVVTASTLNVRSGPGQNYNRIFTLSKDEKVTIKSSSNGWYKIVNSKNREG